MRKGPGCHIVQLGSEPSTDKSGHWCFGSGAYVKSITTAAMAYGEHEYSTSRWSEQGLIQMDGLGAVRLVIDQSKRLNCTCSFSASMTVASLQDPVRKAEKCTAYYNGFWSSIRASHSVMHQTNGEYVTRVVRPCTLFLSLFLNHIRTHWRQCWGLSSSCK